MTTYMSWTPVHCVYVSSSVLTITPYLATLASLRPFTKSDIIIPGQDSWSSVTHRAGVIRARGSGWVGLGVRTDMASASGLLRQLVFLIQDFSHGQRACRKG